MKALDILAESLRCGYIHPTTVLNTLIDLENWGGHPALCEFEQRLGHSVESLRARQHPSAELAGAWLAAVQCYMAERGATDRVA
ncbi:hypothetical protein ACFP81_06050 [Deinococcus lacus]|uniref:Uncharacterized protein n=1 Tax=Deinococcus lacus TaxID=392561 RepID=A0ABW1YFH9_9DEIO